MRVYLIKNEDGIGYYVKDLKWLECIWDDAEDEETYTITNCEMTDDEYEALPEFEGF